ncbi:helix-turn-helix transcriptional regulator [Pelagibius litoralis]|uniref:Helix-turn-helix transcriptional regulator n=1 Tax=Pelagibius litoralis TaxID=374515 RepID=A0A967EZW2_9PROT|nr:helix-turn-helix transcriptional regulator [Pelagibius litoralis]NIA70461.1 helix-turn-helix transcriptional regulator [Pelagibius litoralis]
MEIRESFLGCIESIYRSSLRPEGRWVEPLDRIAQEMGARGSTLFVFDPRHAEASATAFSSIYPDPESAAWRYWEENISQADEPGYKALAAKQPIGFFSDTELLGIETDAEHKSHLSVRYTMAVYGTQHRAVTRLSRHGAWLDMFAVQYACGRGAMTAEEAQIGALLAPHLAKAVEMQRNFAILQSRFESVIQALDHFQVGIAILGIDGSRVIANSFAEMMFSDRDGVFLDASGRLAAWNRDESGTLRAAVIKAARTAAGTGREAECLLAVRRRSGSDPYLVSVSPVGDDGRALDPGFAGALVTIIDPCHKPSISTLGMQEVFGLTKSEAAVCGLLAEGKKTEDIAEMRALQLETVRSYVKIILAKTKTHSRADLVRLAVLLNPPVDL